MNNPYLWHHWHPPPVISNSIFLLLLFFMIAFNIFYFQQLSDKNNNKITISAKRKLRKHENENCLEGNFASRWQRNKVRMKKSYYMKFLWVMGKNKTRRFYLGNFFPQLQFVDKGKLHVRVVQRKYVSIERFPSGCCCFRIKRCLSLLIMKRELTYAHD